MKPVFFAFRIMVGMGLLMLAVSWLASFYLLRRRALPRWLMLGFVGMTFSGWIATLAGWYVTEIGRQPFLVSGVLRTSEAVTEAASGNIVISLALYLSVYAVLLIAYVRTLFVMARRAIEVEEFDAGIPADNKPDIPRPPGLTEQREALL